MFQTLAAYPCIRSKLILPEWCVFPASASWKTNGKNDLFGKSENTFHYFFFSFFLFFFKKVHMTKQRYVEKARIQCPT